MRKEILEQMDDAVTELELMDEDETTAIKFGDCFFRVNHTFLFILIYILILICRLVSHRLRSILTPESL